MKKLWEKIKPFIEVFKAAKLFYSLFALAVAYSGLSGYRDVSEYMAEPVVEDNSNVQKMHNTSPEKDWLPIIDERISKAVKRLEYEYHGGS